MREKKPYVVISFETTTQAMAMETECRRLGIPGRLIPLPKEISAACGLAWRISQEDYTAFRPQIDVLPVETAQRTSLLL